MTRNWWALLGLVAVASGAVLFVERTGGTGEVVAVGRRWWPVVLIAVGLINLVRLSDHRWAVVGPLLAIAAGATLLLFIFGGLHRDLGLRRDLYPRLWPVLLVLTGGALVFAAARQDNESLSERNELRRFVWLRGERLESTARAFWRARISVLLGSYTLNLRRATLQPPTTVYVNALFGNVDILVDTGTTTTVRRPFVLGIGGMATGDVPPQVRPQLTVSVLALFGDAKVRRTFGVATLAASSRSS